MTRAFAPTHVWTQLRGEAPRLVGPVRRMLVCELRVELVGPAAFEPSMSRVRLVDGLVVRAFTDQLRPITENGR